MEIKFRHKTITFIVGVLAIVTLSKCSYEFPEPPVEESGALGDANFDNPVFIGGTWFSGVHSGALTTKFSPFNVPSIVLNTMAINKVSDWEVFSPQVNSENGHNIYENNDPSGAIGQYLLQYPNPDTVTFEISKTIGETFGYDNGGAEIMNFSFPKTGMIDLTSTVGNDYTSNFGFGGQSVIEQAIARSPSFFVLNAGFEEVMAYALNGGEGNPDVTDAMNYDWGDMLSTALFEQKLDEMIDAFLASGPDVKGALINIPDILQFPYFTDVWYDISPYVDRRPILNEMRNEAAIYNGQLNNYYNQNPQIPFDQRRPPISFEADIIGNWGVVVVDPDLPDAFDSNGDLLTPVRQTTRDERLVMTIESRLNKDLGNQPQNALSPSQYLTEAELLEIQAKITAYNNLIQAKVANAGGRLALVDFNDYFGQLFEGKDLFLEREADGFLIEGAEFRPIIGEFGVFSADGLNLNPRGNSLFANQIIEALNSTFNGDLRKANPNDFAGTPIINAN